MGAIERYIYHNGPRAGCVVRCWRPCPRARLFVRSGRRSPLAGHLPRVSIRRGHRAVTVSLLGSIRVSTRCAIGCGYRARLEALFIPKTGTRRIEVPWTTHRRLLTHTRPIIVLQSDYMRACTPYYECPLPQHRPIRYVVLRIVGAASILTSSRLSASSYRRQQVSVNRLVCVALGSRSIHLVSFLSIIKRGLHLLTAFSLFPTPPIASGQNGAHTYISRPGFVFWRSRSPPPPRWSRPEPRS